MKRKPRAQAKKMTERFKSHTWELSRRRVSKIVRVGELESAGRLLEHITRTESPAELAKRFRNFGTNLASVVGICAALTRTKQARENFTNGLLLGLSIGWHMKNCKNLGAQLAPASWLVSPQLVLNRRKREAQRDYGEKINTTANKS